MEIESTLSVVCGDLTGLLLLDNFSARRECVSCEHGLVKPSTFERLAGKGHCKSWKRTVRCAETGKDICSLIEAGKIQLLDEPEWVIKRRESIKSNKSLVDGEGEQIVKRKRGRPKKSDSGASLNNSSVPNLEGVLAPPLTSLNHMNGTGSEQQIPNETFRKRKKMKGCTDSLKLQKANKSKLNENGVTNGTSSHGSPSMNQELPVNGHEGYKKVSRKCKWKRVRHNEFERSVNAIIKDRKAPVMNMRLTCPVCKTIVEDVDALRYHDLMFHSSVSSKVFLESEDQSTSDSFNDFGHDKSTYNMFSDSDNSFFGLTPHSKRRNGGLPSLNLLNGNLNNGTGSSMEDMLNGSPESASSSRDDSNPTQLSVLSAIAKQYQELVGISKETLIQTSSLRDQMKVLAKSVEEIKSDMKHMSKALTLANMPRSAVRDDIATNDYQTFFNTLEKFISSNGQENGR